MRTLTLFYLLFTPFRFLRRKPVAPLPEFQPVDPDPEREAYIPVLIGGQIMPLLYKPGPKKTDWYD